jgi:Domain of Unknown Function (DUF1080)
MRGAIRSAAADLCSKLVFGIAIGAATLGAFGCSSGGSQPGGTGGTAQAGGSPGSGGSAGTAASGTGGVTNSGSGGVGTGGTVSQGTGGAAASGAGGMGAGAGTGTGGLAASGGSAGTGNPAGGSAAGGGRAGSGGGAAGTTGGTGATGSGGAVSGSAGAGGAGGGPPIVDLFNGTDLTGFNVYKATTFANNAPGMLVTGAAAQMIFKPENGMIHVYADLPDQSLQYHYLLQTVASYGKYNLSWDYKWGTKKFQIDATGRGTDLTMFPRDAGVFWQIHGDKTQVWPSAIEFQNKWGTTGDIFAIYADCKSPVVPGKTNPYQFEEIASGGVSTTIVGGLTEVLRSGNFEMPGVGPNASTGEGSDWNSCLLQVDAGTAVYTVNGHIVNRVLGVTNSGGTPVTSGFIAWQAEQAEVYYRNLRIQVLP